MSGARWWRTGWSLLSAAVLALIVFGPLLAPYPATATVGPPFRPPGGAHLLGTDVVGRDVLSRVLHGGLPLLSVSIAALAAAYAIGLAVGLVAGLRAGADRWLMRPIDVLVVIPWFLLLAVIATALGAGAPAMVLTACLAAAPWIARVVRTCVHELAATGYVEAARGRREPLWRIAVVEVLPNLRAVLAADAGIRSAGVISVVAVGGFLGLGLRPPSPDWALMITENRPGFGVQPWSVLAPALLVMLLVVPVNMLGDRALGSPSRVRRASGTRTGCSIDTGSADTDAVRVDGLTVRTDRGVPVLTDIAFRLPPGGGLAVVGPSGAGKTTLVSAVLGALPPGWTATGSVSIGVAGGGARRVGFVPQDPATGLNPALRIGAAIGEIARLRPRSPAERATTVCAALRRVGLPDDREFRGRYPHQLSGGQQQRVLLAMALLDDPAVVVLDEPTTGLDRRTRAELLDTLVRLRRESGTAFLVITHDLPAVAPMADQVLELDHGHVKSLACTPGFPGAPPEPVARTRRRTVSAPPILRAEDLTIGHRGRPVAAGLSFDLAAGSCLAVTGRSGTGKTTLARTVAGLHLPVRGHIRLGAQPLPARVEARTAAHCGAIQLVAQNPAGSLNPSHRVGTQIARPLRLLRGMDAARARAEAGRLLAAVRLDPEIARRRPGQLSGGQQQRVALARALAAAPRVLICDEITASLDDDSREVVVELLDRLRREGMSLLLISHQESVIDRLADDVLDLGAHPGERVRPAASGAPGLVTTAPEETDHRRDGRHRSDVPG
ncbi:MAG TPA: ATP-binding cassette domain-containing protein [Nocardia sp.]|uniref:ABC transporter ATP-binding protein/permease n=1 Tax=Nocardia sp. TaxID=1821 RepID=UPI002B4AF0C4|nr:ATP-binding cassette domain-containing protein [Nocardia sp.]HLS79375.1 ATP-binding cassette domain-containing protein [Nocardia sp.]